MKRTDVTCVKGQSGLEYSGQLGWYHDYYGRPFWGGLYFLGGNFMAKSTVQRPRGTQDVIPNESHKWQTIEKVCRETAEQFGFKEIRTPTFEDTGLFVRSVGDTTDVVQKEMYTVSAKGDSEFTLKPEGTAGVIRAMLENGILNDGVPQKLFYITPCFRHEKPQAGRLREFHQFGCEMVGPSSPSADADIIALAKSVIERLGIKDVTLHLNSIGCPECRAKYHKALKEYFSPKKDELCNTCQERLNKNPMRILDCKSPICSDIAKNAPVILDYLCEDCNNHFNKLQEILKAMGIEFVIDTKIVRGLDYYTKTVFEFITDSIGAQGTILGGGRYDGLVETLGSQPTPALGFGSGIERLLLTMENSNCEFIEKNTCDLYIASMGDDAQNKAASLAMALRDEGFFTEYDLMDRGLKAQMKYANKINAKFTLVLGDNELETKQAKLKQMDTGEETDISLDEKFCDKFSERLTNFMFKDLLEDTGL